MIEYRCSLPDCRSLLFKANLIHGKVEILCKCGCMNKFEVIPDAKSKPEGRDVKTLNGNTRHVSPSAS